MDLLIFQPDFIFFALRWIHFLAGIVWIGLLYYFNFVQGSFMAEADAGAKSQVTQKLLPRALWWFRWGAMITFISGWLYLIGETHRAPGILGTSWGVNILVGALLASFMWFNVWFIIWPNQKVVIANAVATASGQPANPAAPVSAGRALVASRTNTMFSVPMLFFMGAAKHLPYDTTNSNITLFFVLFGVLLAALQLNAFKGKTGPLTTVKGVISCGFILSAVLYILMECCLV